MGDLQKHIKKTRKRESVLHKTSGYASNCGTGFQTKGYCQIHHVVCVSCIADRKGAYPDDMEDYLEACLWITKWDLNDGHNLVGLPLNKQYRRSDGKTPVDQPSHQVDHNTRDGYTSEVFKYLKENVWNSLTAKKKVHDVDAGKLRTQLRNASDVFRGRLEKRGKRGDLGSNPGGTGTCWKNRFERAYKDLWYHPFSMGKNPSRRSPGVSLKRLTRIFKKL
jgi:hypothetical protein